MSIRNVNLELERNPVGLGIRKVCQRVKYSDFTDGGSTAGTLVLTKTIPAGSFVLGSKVKVETAFTGGANTTATLGIGDGSDADTFSGNTTHNIYTVADNLVKAAFITADCGLVAEGSATSITLTATVSADWTTISAGQAFVEVYYLSTNPEPVEYYENKWLKSTN